MTKLLCILVILLSLSDALAQSKRIGTFRFEKKKASHAAKIIFRTRTFDPSRHKVGYDESIGNTVDGRKAYGAEALPQAEIASMTFFFDGREIHIPRRLFSDCYDPNLLDNPLTIRFSPDFQSVMVSMWGSDGAGGYNVVWKLKKNGRHARLFKES